MSVQPYHISVPDAKISALKERLALSTFPDELDSAGWEYGAPLADVRRLASYWQNQFDWRKAEAKLNELPNYRTPISVDGYGDIDIHFVHQTSDVKEAIPLLFVHGWPGSFIEVTKILSLLKGDGKNPAFHVVAPSLPNYGFSGGVRQKGFNLKQYAEACHKLMQKLGYNQYVMQGGDWGFHITRSIALHYPESAVASHINMIRAQPPRFTSNPITALQHQLTPYTKANQEGFKRTKWFTKEGRGYLIEQSTKPQTLGYGLADSPVGLLAWIYEKLHDWTDAYPWTEDEICTWISIYWFSTAGPAASLRIYYEVMHSPKEVSGERMSAWIGGVKLGCAHFPREITVVPTTWGRTLGPVVYESEHDKGGHFAAWERPDAISNDLNQMFKRNGPCQNIVKGRSGYDKARL